MPNVEGMELGLFGEVIKSINRALTAADAISKYIWVSNCEKCLLRKHVPEKEAVMCEYPERINHVFKNNCTYESCPLINR